MQQLQQNWHINHFHVTISCAMKHPQPYMIVSGRGRASEVSVYCSGVEKPKQNSKEEDPRMTPHLKWEEQGFRRLLCFLLPSVQSASIIH